MNAQNPDIAGGGGSRLDVVAHDSGAGTARPFLMITFQCRGASAYQRVYRSLDGTHYAARCPRCGKGARFVVGAGGTGARAFVVECG
jgi:hypothetical protein